MGISTSNIVCFVVAIGFLAFHAFLFIDLNLQQQASLRRIDDLEKLLKNATTKNKIEKGITSDCLEEPQMGLNSELPKNADDNVKVLRVLRKVQRLEKRVEKYIVDSLRKKEDQEYRRPRRSYHSSGKKKYALFTVWGVSYCSARSVLLHSGQMVTTDGSDYLCLSDDPDDIPARNTKTPGRNLGSSVSLRGVTYGDVEDVLDFVHENAPLGNRNNKTVPCAVCARQGKSGSKMMSAVSDIRKRIRFNLQQEYYGILMASKESNKLICLSTDAKEYKVNKNKYKSSNPVLSETVQIHPAELKCNSMYCEADDQKNKDDDTPHYYKEGYRIKCMVVTF